MNKTTTIKMGVSLSILAFSLAVSTASAQTCGSQPTCADLGFIYNAKTCPVTPSKSLKCPFDTSLSWCPDPVDTEPATCPTGSLRPDQIPAWSKIFGVYNVSLAPTWCKKNTGIPDAFAEALTKCPKTNGNDIFKTAANETHIGTGDLSSGTKILLIAGAGCYQMMTQYPDFLNGQYGTLVIIGPDSGNSTYSGHCSTSNSTFQGKFMGVDVDKTGSSTSATNKIIGPGTAVMIVIENGESKFVQQYSCDNLPYGSNFGNQNGFK